EYDAAQMRKGIRHSEIEEELMSRRDDMPLDYHAEFVKTHHRLYWDDEADDVKTGARGEGPGSIMRMIDLLTQFDLTFDIASLKFDDFMRLLPNDFKRFLDNENRPRSGRRREQPARQSEPPPPMDTLTP